MKQTAVQFLKSKILAIDEAFLFEEIQQALAMEREQMIEFADNYVDHCTYAMYDGSMVIQEKTPEQYFTATFKQ